MYTLTYQKALLLTLFLLVIKNVESLQCIIKVSLLHEEKNQKENFLDPTQLDCGAVPTLSQTSA